MKKMKLSDEQRKVAEDNHLLVYKYMIKNHLDEDWYDVVIFGYLKGIYTWDSSKGTLATWVYSNMRYAMLDELNKEHYKNAEIDKDGVKVYKRKLDIVGYDGLDYIEKSLYTNDNIDFLIDLSNALDKLTYSELKILHMLMLGYSVRQLAIKFGVSRQHIYRVRSDIVDTVNGNRQIRKRRVGGKIDNNSNEDDIEVYRNKCKALIMEYMR